MGVDDHTGPSASNSMMEAGQGGSEKSHSWTKVNGHPIDENTPVASLYLDFDSDLPPRVQPTNTEIPTAPDLHGYTSPLTWSQSRKNVVLALGCLSTFLTAYCAGSYSPPSRLMANDLDTTHTVTLVGITTFCLGFGLAPMVLAPMSEVWGRYPVLVIAECVTVVSIVGCAVMNHIVGMLIMRFVVGAGVSVFSSVVGGMMADLWHKEERNTPMALYSGSVLIGTGAGPLVAAGIVDRVKNPTLAWKWCFWHQVIANVLLLAALGFFLSETRASVILRHKATALNKWYEKLEKVGIYGVLDPAGSGATAEASPRRIRWKVKADEERASLGALVASSSMRPFYMLCTEPVVFFFSLWAAFAWGILYLAFAVVPYLHADDFNASMRTYVAMMAGAAVAAVGSIWQERLLSHRKWRVSDDDDSSEASDPATSSRFWAFMRHRLPTHAPEARLYFTCISSLLLPAGLLGAFLVPSTSDPNDRGTSLSIGIGFATCGIFAVYLASFNYLTDTYHTYASSALAANSFCRNMLGGSFPVVTSYMFDSMGVRGAGGMLGGLALLLTAIPFVLVAHGGRIRSRSKMAIMLQK